VPLELFFVLLLATRSAWKWESGAAARSAVAGIRAIFCAITLVVAFATIAAVLFGVRGGGQVGAALATQLVRYVNPLGAIFVGLLVVFLPWSQSPT
jgi:hypothetical protein